MVRQGAQQKSRTVKQQWGKCEGGEFVSKQPQNCGFTDLF